MNTEPDEKSFDDVIPASESTLSRIQRNSMYPSNYDDGECTAAPGVMGTTSCHRYPGCGCGGSSTPHEQVSERTAREGYGSGVQRSAFQDRPSFERPSDWHIRTFHKIETLSKGFFRIWMDKNQFAENERYFPCKVDGNKLIFHKSVINKSLSEYFIVRSKR